VLNSTSYAELTTRKRFFFHLSWDSDEDKFQSVKREGLVQAEARYDGFWRTRPGHVFIGTPRYLRKLFSDHDKAPWDLWRVDTTKLDRRKLNPDEDHFMPGLGTGPDGNQYFGGNLIKGRTACCHFKREVPPTKWLWEWQEYLGLAPLPSLGEWADAIGLGSNPAETRYSIAKGSLAYGGTVPPDALTLVKTTRACA
jgi:hypothetical protein